MAKKNAKTAKKPHPQNPVVRAAFATIIRELRRRLSLSQKQVAERSGYSEKYIGFLELRKNTPSLTAAIMISVGLGEDPGKIVNDVLSVMRRFKRLEGKDHEAADI
ncbi:MAG: helix-turn-helix transcriptional regulator [Candidatus Acidiferrales bacterium]|jgi:transcriptional regulator with XRE-family HTH domain